GPWRRQRAPARGRRLRSAVADLADAARRLPRGDPGHRRLAGAAVCMSSLRALIVDDEQPAADRLVRLLDEAPGAEACGVAVQAHDVIERCRELVPDVVFLD